jgi:hypothetical protein
MGDSVTEAADPEGELDGTGGQALELLQFASGE